MSSVRMCDRCGNIFSELADGWQAFSASTMKKNPETGKRETVVQMMDACEACAIGTEPVDSVRDDAGFFQRQLLEGKVADLEAELRKLKPETVEGDAVEEPEVAT